MKRREPLTQRLEWEVSQAQEYFWLSEAKKIIYCFLPKPSSTATCSEFTIKLLNKMRTLMLTVKTSFTVSDPSSTHCWSRSKGIWFFFFKHSYLFTFISCLKNVNKITQWTIEGIHPPERQPPALDMKYRSTLSHETPLIKADRALNVISAET